MSYQVIARKWRPQTFDEVSGQGHVTTPLRNAIRTGRVPHAVLLTGPRGTGKTTLARILAKCLNCEKGPTDTPCGSCPSCSEIASGVSTDVQEIDAASRTSVDDVRELIESIRYAAAPGRHKIFVVDEVHMLSTAAFNALLKTLEEPPPQSLFVFATTNPEKIPFTVISRCQRYDLRRISSAEVVARLASIAEAESVTISPASLRQIALEGDGSMRDSQTLLDQIISYGGNDVADETVAEVLDLVDRRVLLAIAEACVDADPRRALEAWSRAASSGTEPRRLSDALVQLLRDLVVMRIAPDADSLVEGTDEERAELKALAERSEVARLRRMFRALVSEQEDLTWAPQPDAVLEMAIVRLATLPAGDDVAQLLGRIDALERRLSGSGAGPSGGGPGSAGDATTRPSTGGTRGAPARGGKRSAPAETSTTPVAPTTPAPRETEPAHPPTTTRETSPARPLTTARETSQGDSAVKSVTSAENGVTPQQPTPRDGHSPKAEAPPVSSGSSQAASEDAPLPVVFDRLRSFAQSLDRGLFASLEGGELRARDADGVRIAVRGAFHAKRLQDRQGELQAVCERFFGSRLRVTVEEAQDQNGASDPESSREDARKRRQAALEHPAVNIALKELGAEIVEIRPLGPGGSR